LGLSLFSSNPVRPIFTLCSRGEVLTTLHIFTVAVFDPAGLFLFSTHAFFTFLSSFASCGQSFPPGRNDCFRQDEMSLENWVERCYFLGQWSWFLTIPVLSVADKPPVPFRPFLHCLLQKKTPKPTTPTHRKFPGPILFTPVSATFACPPLTSHLPVPLLSAKPFFSKQIADLVRWTGIFGGRPTIGQVFSFSIRLCNFDIAPRVGGNNSTALGNGLVLFPGARLCVHIAVFPRLSLFPGLFPFPWPPAVFEVIVTPICNRSFRGGSSAVF